MNQIIVAIDSDGSPTPPSLDSVTNALDERFAHLEAMSVIVTGQAHEEFCNWSDEIQGDYLWAIYERVKELRALWGYQQKLLATHQQNVA